jgi:hypothetical protein
MRGGVAFPGPPQAPETAASLAFSRSGHFLLDWSKLIRIKVEGAMSLKGLLCGSTEQSCSVHTMAIMSNHWVLSAYLLVARSLRRVIRNSYILIAVAHYSALGCPPVLCSANPWQLTVPLTMTSAATLLSTAKGWQSKAQQDSLRHNDARHCSSLCVTSSLTVE